MSSCPELDALVARIGLHATLEAARLWVQENTPPTVAPSGSESPCALHSSGPPGTGTLCATPNTSGYYSTFSPPCNGCEKGAQEQAAGVWMSGITVRVPMARLQTIMLDCLREAEEDPTALWKIDNLIMAMEAVREAGGDGGDNYAYCQQRLAALQG